MEETEFEVEGPDKHHVHHEATSGHNGFATRIAVLTACLATLGALCSYQSGKTMTDAVLLKNEAAMRKTEAADHWAFYQAKGIKQMLTENAAELAKEPASQSALRSKAKQYQEDKDQLQRQARALEGQANTLNDESEQVIHLHHRWAQAMMIIQIAISLAAITILTKKRWLYFSALAAAVSGLLLAILGLLGV